MKYRKQHINHYWRDGTDEEKSSLRILKNIAFYLDDPKVHAETCDYPLKGFSALSLSISPEEVMIIFRSLFPPQDHTEERKEIHYWLDASFLLISPHIYGERNGETFRISNGSFLNAYIMGLGKIDEQYNILWKRFNEAEHVCDNQLERIISRSDVTILPEIASELTKRTEWNARKMDRVCNSYKKILERRRETRERFLRKMEERIRTDSTFDKIREISLNDSITQCKKVAEEHGINTSEVDNKLIAYALANAAIQRGQPQIVITGDFGIADLVNVMGYKNNGIAFSVHDEYYKPFKIHSLQIEAICT